MAQRSSKHSEVKTVNFGFDGGLNLHDSPANIADNQMIEARNYFYADKGGLLVTRPGVKLVTRASINDVLLTVNVYPTNGTWRVVGSNVWLASGATIAVTAGRVYLEFTDVSGFTKPTGYYVDVTDNAEITVAYIGTLLVSGLVGDAYGGCFGVLGSTVFTTGFMCLDWSYVSYEFKNNVFWTVPLALPKNAVVLSATLDLYAWAENQPPVQIKAVQAANASPPTSNAEARAMTLGSESAVWTISGEPRNESIPTSVNFSSVVQEAVGHAGWESGNLATFVFETTKYQSKFCFTDFSAHEPVFSITWQGVHA